MESRPQVALGWGVRRRQARDEQDSSAPGEKLPVGLVAADTWVQVHPWRAAVPRLCLSFPICKTRGGMGWGETISRILPGVQEGGIRARGKTR